MNIFDWMSKLVALCVKLIFFFLMVSAMIIAVGAAAFIGIRYMVRKIQSNRKGAPIA